MESQYGDGGELVDCGGNGAVEAVVRQKERSEIDEGPECRGKELVNELE